MDFILSLYDIKLFYSWSDEERKEQENQAKRFLKSMGLSDLSSPNTNRLQIYRETFESLDDNQSGLISLSQYQQALNTMSVSYDPEKLKDMFPGDINEEELSLHEFITVKIFKNWTYELFFLFFSIIDYRNY